MKQAEMIGLARKAKAPAPTCIHPITYGDAFREFQFNGRHPFSFLAIPHNQPKTILLQGVSVVTIAPSAFEVKQ